MQVLDGFEELRGSSVPLILAIGFFDGVHRGHQKLIGHAVREAQNCGGAASVVTFEPHPAKLLRPQQAPGILTPLEHKKRLVASLGVPYFVVLQFDALLAQQSAEEFSGRLTSDLPRLKEICVGPGWGFGRGREGNAETLRQLGRRDGFEVTEVDGETLDGLTISSTLIRNAVQTGDLDRARRALGRRFEVLGTVVHGRKLGGSIGFPTANLLTQTEVLPPFGVYTVRVEHEREEFRGVANLGVRPTVGGGSDAPVLEVHLFDFYGELYGQQLLVRFHDFLRPERKFDGLDALTAQIRSDVATAKARD